MTSRRPERSERGSLTLAVTLLAVGLLLVGGLVVDGGRHMNAKSRALAVAEEAARAGASQTDISAPDPELIPENVAVAVADYCDLAQSNDPTITSCRYTGTGAYAGTGVGGRKFPWVEVTVTAESDTVLLGLIGVGSMDSTVSARANAVEGVIDPLDDPGMQTIDPIVSHPTVTTSFPTATGPLPTDTAHTPSTYTATGKPPCKPPNTMVLNTASTFSCSVSTTTISKSTTKPVPTTPSNTPKPKPTGPTGPSPTGPSPTGPSSTPTPTDTTVTHTKTKTSVVTIVTPRNHPTTPPPTW